MSEWVIHTLGEVCDAGNGVVQTGPFGSQLHESDYQETGTPVVMPKDIINGKIDESSIARVSVNHIERLSRHKLSLGDIVYGRRGDIGRQAIVRENNVGWLCGSGCVRITLGKGPLDPEFLHLYLQLPEVVGWIANQAIGATLLNLNTKIIRSIPIRYPRSIHNQKQLVAILTAYDDLIETNQRRITLLERMAEAIYREWFVRLRFPGHETATFEKGVPVGWEIKAMENFCAAVIDGTHDSPKPTQEGFYLVTGKNLKNGMVDFEGAYKISENDHSKISKRSGLKAWDILFSNIGTLGSLALVTENPSYSVKNIIVFRPRDPGQAMYLYFFLRDGSIVELMHMISSGASQQFISLGIARNFKVFDPGPELLAMFGKKVLPLQRQIQLLEAANKMLIEIRDRLLTRLISGKLLVEDLDIQYPPSMLAENEAGRP